MASGDLVGLMAVLLTATYVALGFTFLKQGRQLGRQLGLEVVAEGVESAAQASFLEGIGCDLAQGYHFAKPMRRDELEKTLDSGALGL